MHTFLDQLSWRNAEKHFDPNRKLEAEKLNKILEATRMAPSSFGLQPYHIYVISNPEIKKQLRAEAYDQAQFTEASHLLVFASRSDLNPRIDEYLQIATGGNPEAATAMQTYMDMMRGMINSMPPETQKTWADRQSYLALGFALAAAAELEVDSCPMEGFNSNAFDRILDLPQHMRSVVTLSLGYRKGDPAHPKVRYSKEDLFSVIE